MLRVLCFSLKQKIINFTTKTILHIDRFNNGLNSLSLQITSTCVFHGLNIFSKRPN